MSQPTPLIPIAPPLIITAPGGGSAQVYPHGGHVTAWAPMRGSNRLFLSQTSGFAAGQAIRGGVPVCFPQFSGLGPLPKHGFARTLPWQLVDVVHTPTHESVAVLRLADTESTRAIWPHRFDLSLTVTLAANSLSLALAVVNPDTQSFEFTCALHSYLRVDDISNTEVHGLGGYTYYDQVDRATHQQSAETLTITSEVDRIYYRSPEQLRLTDDTQTLTVSQTGFTDTVIWNPWIQKGAALADLEPDGYRRFVCIEAATIGQPIALAPGQSWQGTQTLQA